MLLRSACAKRAHDNYGYDNVTTIGYGLTCYCVCLEGGGGGYWRVEFVREVIFDKGMIISDQANHNYKIHDQY